MALAAGEAATRALTRLCVVFQRALPVVHEDERRFIVVAIANEVSGLAVAMLVVAFVDTLLDVL